VAGIDIPYGSNDGTVAHVRRDVAPGLACAASRLPTRWWEGPL